MARADADGGGCSFLGACVINIAEGHGSPGLNQSLREAAAQS